MTAIFYRLRRIHHFRHWTHPVFLTTALIPCTRSWNDRRSTSQTGDRGSDTSRPGLLQHNLPGSQGDRRVDRLLTSAPSAMSCYLHTSVWRQLLLSCTQWYPAPGQFPSTSRMPPSMFWYSQEQQKVPWASGSDHGTFTSGYYIFGWQLHLASSLAWSSRRGLSPELRVCLSSGNWTTGTSLHRKSKAAQLGPTLRAQDWVASPNPIAAIPFARASGKGLL